MIFLFCFDCSCWGLIVDSWCLGSFVFLFFTSPASLKGFNTKYEPFFFFCSGEKTVGTIFYFTITSLSVFRCENCGYNFLLYCHFFLMIFPVCYLYVSKRNTRNSQLLNIPLFKTTTGQRSFSYRVVNIWNNLPTDIKLCKNVAAFKIKLRKYLLNEFLIS